MINGTALSQDGMAEVYWWADNLLTYQPLIYNKQWMKELSERKRGSDYPRRKQERGETQEGKPIQKNRAMTSSHLAFPADSELR